MAEIAVGNIIGAIICCIIGIVGFVMFGVNKSKQDKVRADYPTIGQVKREAIPNSTLTKLTGLPTGLTAEAYEKYDSTLEATWMWVGIVGITIALLLLLVK
jgi:hypothetical protein